jgi:putative tryptophan/tyrosine transport system substrate-binding protein
VRYPLNAGARSDQINRRTVLAGIAAALAPASLAAQAQPRDGMRRIGVLLDLLPSDPEGQAEAAAFAQGLGALNWREGDNLRMDWRWVGGDAALLERYGPELVALGPEVILAVGTASVEALQRQTSTIPIVFTLVTDPVGQGFVASLAHPGGNITGFSGYDTSMVTKWLAMLTQITPPVARVAVLYHPATTPYAGLMLHAIEEAAPSLGAAVRDAPIHDDADIEAMMTGLAREERSGLLVLPNAFTNAHRDAIVALAARYRLPAVYPFRFFPEAGGLMSYGSDRSDPFRRAADYVDRILRGATPGDLPVQQPTRFELVLNVKTAKALGVTFPVTLLASANEVIE